MARRSIRRTQAVVPFGVGSIVEFEDEALMPAGIDMWPAQAEKIHDPRLAARLHVAHFKVPPPKREAGVPNTGEIPFVRFPQWHFCPRCRWLKKADLFEDERPRCDNRERSPRTGSKEPCGVRPEKKRPRMLPLRFVAVCPNGHIEDFPWKEWVHTEKGKELERGRGCDPPSLYFYPTQLGGLSGLLVKCEKCNKTRSLMGVTSKNGLKGLTCSGARPWLGKVGAEECASTDPMVALQRGASNLYFPEVDSSILIPPFSTKVHRVLNNPVVREILESSRHEGEIETSALQIIARREGVDAEQLRQALEERSAVFELADDISETEYRYAEYRALHQERRERDDSLICRPQSLSDYATMIREFFSHVSLVESLAETRVLTGFRRIDPAPTTSGPGALALGRLDWLPAFRVHGEGIFLAVNSEKVGAFCNGFADQRLADALRRAAERGFRLDLSYELVLLHTFAHLLIKRLSFEAGYGASSIRERLYSAPDGHPQRMAGVLLYTAAGDAEGTLGGLVGLGKPGRLERILAGALEDARWCASDPICVESSGQGPGSLNIAACHACALLPETSCELQNRLLDRRIVRGFFDGKQG